MSATGIQRISSVDGTPRNEQLTSVFLAQHFYLAMQTRQHYLVLFLQEPDVLLELIGTNDRICRRETQQARYLSSHNFLLVFLSDLLKKKAAKLSREIQQIPNSLTLTC